MRINTFDRLIPWPGHPRTPTLANVLKLLRRMHDAQGIRMGIKPSYIKRLGEELIDRQPDRFGRDFKENKTGVSEGAAIGSKRVRNRVAGYITRKHNTGKKA